MNDKRFDRLLRETAEEYNRPPEAPKDAMWAEIQRKRGQAPKPVSIWRRPIVLAPLAAAAILILGIGLGRWSALGPDMSAPGDGVAETAPEPNNSYFRVAAERHLQQTETLLTMFVLEGPVDEVIEREKRVYDWASKLLEDTRLLIDSPASDDPALRSLLTDLELYLARIVRASGGHPGDAKDKIHEDLRDEGVLMRLRTQLPAGHV